MRVITGDRKNYCLIFDAHRTGIRDGRRRIRHIHIDVDAGVRRQRDGDGVGNRLRIGLFCAGLIGLIHAVGIDELLFHMGGGSKRREKRNIKFHRNRGFFRPALGIGVGNRGGGGGALFIGILLFHGVFKVVVVFRRHLVAVRAATQGEAVALLLQTFDGIVICHLRTCETVFNTFDFEVIEKLNIVAITATLIHSVRRHPIIIGSCRYIIYREVPFRQAVQNAGTAGNGIFLNDITDSRPQAIGRILWICIICWSKAFIAFTITIVIVPIVECFRQNTVCNGDPLPGKFRVLNHCLENLLLGFRQIVGIRRIENIPVFLSRHRSEGCCRQHAQEHNENKHAA